LLIQKLEVWLLISAIRLWFMLPSCLPGSLPLYLTRKSIHKPNDGTWAVTNWPNTLSFPVQRITHDGHNIAGKRYDVWFYGPDGYVWHGVQYGETTQIVHCKRSSERVERAA
jgi:hypothetical protein